MESCDGFICKDTDPRSRYTDGGESDDGEADGDGGESDDGDGGGAVMEVKVMAVKLTVKMKILEVMTVQMNYSFIIYTKNNS